MKKNLQQGDIFADEFSERPLWWQDAAPTDHALQDGRTEFDVVVVGSGYAGLSCAHELARNGSTVLVVDAESCGFGASTRNAGFLSGRAGVSKQIDLEALVGRNHAGRIFDEADEAASAAERITSTTGFEAVATTTLAAWPEPTPGP